MPRVLAYQCPNTGKLFVERDRYQQHLKQLARERQRERKEAKALAAYGERIAELRQLGTFGEIAEWLMEHAVLLQTRNGRSKVCRTKVPLLTDVRFTDMVYRSSCSNSHNCPHNGVTNWHGDQALPRGYPGYKGKLSFTYKNMDPFQFLRGTGVNTGSGGGHFDQILSEVTLFDADFPNLTFVERLNGTLDMAEFRQGHGLA